MYGTSRTFFHIGDALASSPAWTSIRLSPRSWPGSEWLVEARFRLHRA